VNIGNGIFGGGMLQKLFIDSQCVVAVREPDNTQTENCIFISVLLSFKVLFNTGWSTKPVVPRLESGCV
jgi:hypothetical protein